MKKTESELVDLLLKCPAAGSAWRHRNGTVYRVCSAAIIEATLEPAVVYRPDNGNPFVTWVRPLSEFLDGRFTHDPERSESD